MGCFTYTWGYSLELYPTCGSPWILTSNVTSKWLGPPYQSMVDNQGGPDLLFQPTLRGVRGILETYRLSCRPGEFLGGSIGIHEKCVAVSMKTQMRRMSLGILTGIHEWLKFMVSSYKYSKYSSPIWRIWVTWNPLILLVVF